ncbi:MULTISPECIES: hypothetical protein [unclassified Paenibacillus]|uniref:hypothetical protein n=1 Tax=unclassified Paenibacillus TaxID=185978 RepID=UPI001F3C28B9|nr:hypothetical protein [Paenibacillus sp. JJ-223]CAH1201629.1 hypothetical protein PAECIP111890_01965 [Paenibacillus sp. JJ-223]
MKKFFGVILFMLCFLPSLSLAFQTAKAGGFDIVVAICFHLIPSLTVLYVVVKLFKGQPLFGQGKPKESGTKWDDLTDWPGSEPERQQEGESEHEGTPPDKVSVHCPGCGAQKQVLVHSSSQCEFCGSTLRAS